MPYWVGTKNGLVVTWLMKTNFHLGCDGKLPSPPPPDVALLVHAARKPGIVVAAPAIAALRNSCRRVGLKPAFSALSAFSTASSPNTSRMGSMSLSISPPLPQGLAGGCPVATLGVTP